jgi:apolipoprotein N-acyltransferase
LGLVVGYLSWGNTLEMTILSLLLFLFYLLLERRYYFFLFALGYYFIASRGLFIGIDNYYNNIFYAFLSWGGVALLSSLTWILIWSNSFLKRVTLFPFALLLTIIPPMGFISGVNPLPTIAVLFPNFGFMGLLIGIILIYLMAFVWRRYCYYKYTRVIFTLFIIGSISIIYLFPNKIEESNNLGVINSNIEYLPMSFDKFEEYKRIKKFFYLVQNSKSLMTLLPENALGNYSNVQSMLWKDLDKNRTVLAGANIFNDNYTKSRNVLMYLNYQDAKIVYKQRVPMPIEMWRPFTNHGTEATIYKQPIIVLNKKKFGVFICYEELLVYPYLQTFFYKPDMLLGVSNLYWAKGTNIKRIEEETMQLWSLLFGVPLKFSVNE